VSNIDDAILALRTGRLIVMPTDTVYGVAALPRAHGAVASIFEAKGRLEGKPIPVLGASIRDLQAVVRFNERAVRLAGRFWPGPLTLVLPRAPFFPHDIGGDDSSTVGVRVPDHDLALELLGRSGPLAVSSANRSGSPPATTVGEARTQLGGSIAVYLDGGDCSGDVSTVVSMTGEPEVLREGAVRADQILRS
jgi:L-threonylcarbamoyladenylate synthase